jgi:hypothetical protein
MSYFLHVLTLKGLRYLLDNHANDPALIAAIRHELTKRQQTLQRGPPAAQRELDGYERDQ